MPRFRSFSTSSPSTPPPPAATAPAPGLALARAATTSSSTAASPNARSGTTSSSTLLSRGFRSLRRAGHRSMSVSSSPIPSSPVSSNSSLPRSPLAVQVDKSVDTENQTTEATHANANANAETNAETNADANADVNADAQQQQHSSSTTEAAASSTDTNVNKIHIRLVPIVGFGNRCFVFDVVDQDLYPGDVFKIGRYSDRNTAPDRLSFKSKVVSRVHAELWTENGKVYLRDVGSSSGTFVNRARLSLAGQRSSPQEVRDGDVVQLGVDYQGGVEPMYRAVRMRVEINRVAPKVSQPFSRQAFQQLRQHLLVTVQPPLASTTTTTNNNNNNLSPNTLRGSPMPSDIQECCICLYAIAPLQALFITPCSHTFHFKCLRPILFDNYPGFSCPLCRTYSDLEASVAVEASDVLQALGMSYGSEEEGRENKTEEEKKEDEEDGEGGVGHSLQQVETVHDPNQSQNPFEVDIAPPLLEEEEEEQSISASSERPLDEEEELRENPHALPAPLSSAHHPFHRTSNRASEGPLSTTLVATPPTFEGILSASTGSPRS